uniref:lipopolysaccharide-binding protein-like n=1 Tax=Myxine glutinosa TaxID=7769 RepID=UPI00358EACAE
MWSLFLMLVSTKLISTFEPPHQPLSGTSASSDKDASNLLFVITSNGMNWTQKQLVRALEGWASSFVVPVLTGRLQTMAGMAFYGVAGLGLHNFTVGASELVPEVGNALHLRMSGISGTARADWLLIHKLMSDKGSFELSVSDAALSTTLVVRRQTGGHPALELQHCSAMIGHVGLRFFGDGSWLYNLLKRFISAFIDNKLEKEVCHALQGYMSNDLQRVMQFLPLSTPIPNTSIVFDYALVAEPRVVARTFQFPLKGSFPSLDPGSVQPTHTHNWTQSLPPELNRMMYVAVSESFMNSAARAFYQAGLMKWTMDWDALPQSLTSTLKHTLPKAHNSPLSFQLSFDTPPIFSASESGLSSVLNGTMSVLNRESDLLFSLHLHCQIKDGPQGVLLHSVMNYSMQYLNSPLIIPVIGHVHLMRPTVTSGDGFVLVGLDLEEEEL